MRFVTGKDSRLSLDFQGTSLAECVVDQWSADSEYNETRFECLGQTGSYRDADFSGITGTFRFADMDGRIDAFEAAYIQAVTQNLPFTLRCTRTTTYEGGLTRSIIYRNLTISGINQTVERGQLNRQTVNWSTGDAPLIQDSLVTILQS